MYPDVVRRLRVQLGETEAELLGSVLATLMGRVHGILGATLAGVYLEGSFALGSGDIHADVDFLVATHHGLDAEQEVAARNFHRVLPDQEEHWAHVLEGSYASQATCKRAQPRTLPGSMSTTATATWSGPPTTTPKCSVGSCTWQFVEFMAPLIAQAGADDELHSQT